MMTAAKNSKAPTLLDIRNALNDQAYIDLERATKICAQDEWWTWQQALTWIACRDCKDVATLKCWAEFFLEGNDPDFIIWGQYQIARMACGNSADDLERSLLLAIEQGRVSTIGTKSPNGPNVRLEAVEWRGGEIVSMDGTMQLTASGKPSAKWASNIGVNRQDLLHEFPPPSPATPTHRENVEWCCRFIKDGKGKGEGKAWPLFHADPNHAKLSRDFVFRPAWREAKSLITKA
jgi:hypothetical protein